MGPPQHRFSRESPRCSSYISTQQLVLCSLRSLLSCLGPRVWNHTTVTAPTLFISLRDSRRRARFAISHCATNVSVKPLTTLCNQTALRLLALLRNATLPTYRQSRGIALARPANSSQRTCSCCCRTAKSFAPANVPCKILQNISPRCLSRYLKRNSHLRATRRVTIFQVPSEIRHHFRCRDIRFAYVSAAEIA